MLYQIGYENFPRLNHTGVLRLVLLGCIARSNRAKSAVQHTVAELLFRLLDDGFMHQQISIRLLGRPGTILRLLKR